MSCALYQTDYMYATQKQMAQYIELYAIICRAKCRSGGPGEHGPARLWNSLEHAVRRVPAKDRDRDVGEFGAGLL